MHDMHDMMDGEKMMEHKAEGGMMMGGKRGCGFMHWNCCVWPLVSRLAWFLSLVALICAWIATPRPAGFLGYGSLWYFWTTISLGILAIPGSRKHMWACRHNGNCGCDTCKVK